MVPSSLAALETLAWNLWWSWDTDATELFASIDPFRWKRVRHNPVALLQDVGDSRWAELEADGEFLGRMNAVSERFDAYLRAPTWTGTELPDLAAKRVAYLSMEFGLHESIKQYSGGLGVLAGDHLRSASDLGLPLVGVGLLYHEGYFRQILEDGRQVAAYPRNHWARLPLRPCQDHAGAWLTITVPIANEAVKARIWRLDVGRVQLYLLDADIEENTPENRGITAHLYGGDNRMRMRQELLIGLGAPRALAAVGLDVDCWHLNEGHCAFLILELMSGRMAAGATSQAALAAVREHVVFTTHTPVPAGHDRFDPTLTSELIGPWAKKLGFDVTGLLDLGRVHPGDAEEHLTMTVLALRGSSAANGVSKLHGEVSQAMWAALWPDLSVADVPIGHVTNGVHPTFFAAPPTRELFDRVVPAWRDAVWDDATWAPIEDASDADIQALRSSLRARLVAFIAERTGRDLDPTALTFGFARRFAPYKRGNMLFDHADRLHALLTGPRGGQLVFAGKAHPKDDAGKAILSTVVKWSESAEFRDRVVFVEDYDLEVGRLLTSGCDVWVNNPRRPQEASGTSGQKAILNGCLNLSILDGWWPEGFDGTNGWAIGDDQELPSEAEQDARDSASLIQVLEEQVFPEWRALDDAGLPAAWLKRVKRSIVTCAPKFTSHRMVRDYAMRMYGPTCAKRPA